VQSIKIDSKELKIESSGIPDLPFSKQDIYFTAAASKE
jgi:hypothetical protein